MNGLRTKQKKASPRNIMRKKQQQQQTHEISNKTTLLAELYEGI